MKTCQSCGRSYEDDSLVFCLEDGTRLRSATDNIDPNATLHIPSAAPTQPGQTVFNAPSQPVQSTITARPEQFRATRPQTVSESGDGRSRHNPLPWILAIVAIIGISGILMAWLLRGGRAPEVAKHPLPTPASIEIKGDWKECETTDGAGTFCGNWTLTDGQGTGRWGSVQANLSITLNGRNVTITRRDRDSSLQATYSGTLTEDGREISGRVTWCCDGLGDRSGTWNAKKQ